MGQGHLMDMDDETQQEEVLRQLREEFLAAVEQFGGTDHKPLTETVQAAMKQALQDQHTSGIIGTPISFVRISPEEPTLLQGIVIHSDLTRHRVRHQGQEYSIVAVNEPDETILLDNQRWISVWDPTYQILWIPRWPVQRIRIELVREALGVRGLLLQQLRTTLGDEQPKDNPALAKRINRQIRQDAHDAVEQQVSEAVLDQVEHAIKDPVTQQINRAWRS